MHPEVVPLSHPVDLISAGESHSVYGNSKLGKAWFSGKLKSNSKTLLRAEDVSPIDYFVFDRNGIQDIKSGMNHFLILSGHKVYTFGDEDAGALGCVFKKKISRVDFLNPACINIRNITRIYTSDYGSFVIQKKKSKKVQSEKIFVFGLNNY